MQFSNLISIRMRQSIFLEIQKIIHTYEVTYSICIICSAIQRELFILSQKARLISPQVYREQFFARITLSIVYYFFPLFPIPPVFNDLLIIASQICFLISNNSLFSPTGDRRIRVFDRMILSSSICIVFHI